MVDPHALLFAEAAAKQGSVPQPQPARGHPRDRLRGVGAGFVVVGRSLLQCDRPRRVDRNYRAVYQRRDRLRVTCGEALWLVGLEQRCGDDLVAHDPFALAPAPYPVAQVLRDVVGRVDELAQQLLLPVDRDVQPASTAPLEWSRGLARLGAFERDVREVDVYISGAVENE